MPARLLTWKLFALAVAGLIAGLIGILWLRSYGFDVRLAFEDSVNTLRGLGPLTFFTAMALLPVAGCPMSIFFLVAGTAFTSTLGFWGVIAATGGALFVNLSLTYWLARYGLRPWLEEMISRTRYKIPTLGAADHAELTVILRITPGPPFFVQSYLLGLAGVRFGTYLWISWAISLAFGSGFIVFGDALLHGKAKVAFIGIGAIVGVSLMVHLLRRHYGKKSA